MDVAVSLLGPLTDGVTGPEVSPRPDRRGLSIVSQLFELTGS